MEFIRVVDIDGVPRLSQLEVTLDDEFSLGFIEDNDGYNRLQVLFFGDGQELDGLVDDAGVG